ncbi:uncharacterized protein SPAPADRAFT_59737 [Spathaspora passalidarum NRRL Y-27907]|uniref:MICOS complex subunit MIC60 n=1 Tax=Spathaspora passalidarum (strain NRRL Y-27907 / 11-Y1) TaxID=619300 RepID=G3AI08_SPAPN|nr:uncharacterized protein SPAPADRAFT_59737 [Spathaspora passalidarum NRRL Y-27907]EGW34322.1 hypothetical protein SPAPADRAFT_59737 [Spathaspora passalidarum NRRL Y-27907]
MIRSVVSRSTRTASRRGTRWMSQSAIRSNVAKVEAPPLPPAVKPAAKKQKKFSLIGALIKLTLLAGTVYGGTLYVATKNDKVMDFVVEQQLPYHEELLEYIDNFDIDDIKKSYDTLINKINGVKLPTKEDVESITHELEHRGEELVKETKKIFTQAVDIPKSVPEPVEKDTALTPAQQLQKVEIEPVKREIGHLPLIELNSDIAKSVDSTVKSTIASFNKFIQNIDANTLASSDAAVVKTISENINQLATKLNSLTKTFDDELQSKLKVSQTELFSSFTKKELELTENLLEQFNKEKSQLEAKLNEKLANEIQASREAIAQAASNAVSMVRIEQTKNFEKLVAEKLDQERNGRLANLESLHSRVEELEKFAESFEHQLVNNHSRSLIQQSISKIRGLLLAPTADDKPQHLAPHVEALASVANDDEVLQLALKDLTPLLSGESTHSILTPSQLLSRWEQLAPELRSASLLPPNAGLLGHLSSLLFSKLLLPVKGVKAEGKDIESVIARVESSLTRGELDVAVEEASNLKGWCRKLADDWVTEGRKRLEVEFLLNLIESEVKIM